MKPVESVEVSAAAGVRFPSGAHGAVPGWSVQPTVGGDSGPRALVELGTQNKHRNL